MDQLTHSIQTSWQRFQQLWSRDGEALEQTSSGGGPVEGSQVQNHALQRIPKNDRVGQVDRWIAAQQASSDQTSPDLASIRSLKNPLYDYFHPGVWCRTARQCGEKEPSLAAAALQEAIADLWDGPIERVWRYALRRGLQVLAERRRRSGVISFAGLLAVMDPGDGPADWLEPLRQRYRAVMVDEFQDTDPTQWRLLQRAFADRGRLLLLVGDPKQAIYRFRGGDLDTYRQARNQVDRIDDLLDNFRTTEPLMAGLNALMQPGLPSSGLKVPAVRACSNRTAATLPDGDWPLKLLVDQQDSVSRQSAPAEQPSRRRCPPGWRSW